MEIRLVKTAIYKRLTVLLGMLLFLTLPKGFQAHLAGWAKCSDSTGGVKVLRGPESNAIYIEIRVDDYSIVRPPGEYLYQREGDVLIYIENFNLSDLPGNPALPYCILNAALPPGADRNSLQFEIIHLEEEKLPGSIEITPSPPALFDQRVPENEQQTSEIEEWGFGKSIVEGRNTLVYNEDQLYPGEYAKLVSSGQLRKWNVASISLYPIRFNPVQREAFLARHIIAKLTFNMPPRGPGQPIAPKLLKDDTFDDRASEILLNYKQAKEWNNRSLYRIPKTAQEFRPVPDVLPPKKADYVIITTAETYEKSEALLNFCVHKENLGYSVMVVTEHALYTVSESNGDFSFIPGEGGGYEDVDGGGLRPQKIRKWLSEHYVDLGIKYVLLIGDPHPEISDSDDNGISIPMQASWPKAYQKVPTDLYYADLSGNWNLDNDGRFGEWAWHDASDILPEGIDGDCFSVRWEGFLEVVDENDSGAPVDIGFDVITNGPVKVWVDGKPIKNLTIPDEESPPVRPCVGSSPKDGCVPPLKGGTHPLTIEYQQSGGDAHFLLYSVSGAKLIHETKPGSREYEQGLKAKYFNNDSFTGEPKAERVEKIPTLSFPGDRGPEGVDFYSELIVGRIPFYRADNGTAEIENLDSILTKIIAYENQDPDETNWRFNVLSITPDMYSSGADYKGCETLKAEVAPEPLWQWYRIHESKYDNFEADIMEKCRVILNHTVDDTACFERTVNAWKEGRGVVMWRTHGSQTGANRVFENSYCGELDDGMPSIVLMMSCGNGWPEEGPKKVKSLGYSLLEHGAIATISASRTTCGGRFIPANAGEDFPKRNPYLLYYLGKAVFENVKIGEALAHVRSTETGNVDEKRSHWWVVWNNVLAYNLYGDPSLSLFGKGVKSNNDIILLLDGSGSMLREGKWEAAKDASVLLYDLLKALRHPTFQDRYNGIVFRCLGGADASSALFPYGLQNLPDNPLTIESLNRFTPEPNFFTPIGGGLKAALRNLDIQSQMSFSSNKVIVLLSDGRHNCGINPLDVKIPEGVKVYTVGLGEDDIEPEAIADIADSTGAAYKITPSPREMEELFIQIATETSWKLQDVPVEDSKAAVSQDKAAFIVVWDNPEYSLIFELNPPGNGPNLTPDNLDAFSPMKCTYYPPAPHTTHAFYVCEGIPRERLGEWRFANIRNGNQSVNPGDVLLKVIEDPRVIANFDIEKIDHYVGQPMVLSARLTEDGGPLTGVRQVVADLVRSPAFPLGTLLAKNSPSADHPSVPPPNSDRTPRSHYIDGIMKKLKINSLSKPGGLRVELKDNGLGIDRRAGDGIYTGVFTGTEYEGSYTFRFRARGKNRDGVTFARTNTLSKYVKFAANPRSTRVKIVSVEPGQESEYFYATIRVTPRDVFGAYMGPFRGEHIRVWSNSGKFNRGYVDRKNGSYDFTLSYEMGTEPRISVSVGDVIVAVGIKVSPPIVQAPRSHSLHAGLSIPIGSLNTNYNRNYSFVLNLDYHFNPQFSVVWPVLGYHHFNARTSSSRDTYWCNISSNLKYEFTTNLLRPYVNGGPGIYVTERGPTRLGFNIGLGMDYTLNSDWTVELGGDYHHVFTSGSDTQFIVLHTGMIYRF